MRLNPVPVNVWLRTSWLSSFTRDRGKRKRRKRKKKQDDDDDDDDEDDDSTYYLSQDYGDDSNVDPEYRPSKKELKGADKEGDK